MIASTAAARYALVVTGLAGLVAAPFLVSDFQLQLIAKFLCLAMVAVGIGLVWGQGGLLTMGQGVFFGLGGYLMAMHLKLADAASTGGVPDFMMLYGTGEVPWWWEPMRSPLLTLVLIVALPAGVAAALGYAVLRRRVRGAYFAILSQALVAAFALLLVGQQQVTGGTNGLNGFRSFFGYDLADPVNRTTLYYLCSGVLVAMVLLVWQIKRSRFGELLVAVRDQENRMRFLGYDTATVTLVAYILAAVFAAVGGALFVPVVGIISPANVGVVASIGFIVGVAIGGRATVLGPVLGSIGVSWAQETFSQTFPSGWTYVLAALFIVVIAVLPGGVASLPDVVRHRSAVLRRRPESTHIPEVSA